MPARVFVNMLLDVGTIDAKDAVVIDPLGTVTVDMLMAVVITLEFTLLLSSAVDMLAVYGMGRV